MSKPPLPPSSLPIVEFSRDDGTVARGYLVEAQSDFADALITVDFAGREALALPIGTATEVRLQGGSLPGACDLTGQVVFSSLDEIRHRFQLRFPGEAHRSLAPLVNQRNAVRVCPRTAEPVQVHLSSSSSAEEFEGEVLDISGTGMSIRVSPAVEVALRSTWNPRLTIRLPSDSTPIEIQGVIRNRRLVGRGVLYGIAYHGRDGRGYTNLRERIYRYVMGKHAGDLSGGRVRPNRRPA